MLDFMLFPYVALLNDICIYTNNIYRNDINESRSIASAVSTFLGHKNFKYIIKNIVNKALKMWKDGSEYSHIQMIGHFKKLKTYGKYFNERGFERNLKKALIETARKEKINKIVGDGYYPKGYKRPRKKKENS